MGMVRLDIAAPIALMPGISRMSAASASLLNNFEIVATPLIALAIFHEKVSKKLWLGIILFTVSSMILSIDDMSGLDFLVGSLAIAVCAGENFPAVLNMFMALLLGFVAYGLSIVFYIYAQRELGAARTSAYYAVAPFIGVALSLAIFRELPSVSFFTALVIMIAGVWVVTKAGAE